MCDLLDVYDVFARVVYHLIWERRAMQSLAADEAPAFDVGCDGGDCGLLMPGSEGFYYRPL